MAKGMDKTALLGQLERITYEKGEGDDKALTQQMSLATALRALANLTHEREYTLCQAAAKHLLGKVPEPDDADLEEWAEEE